MDISVLLVQSLWREDPKGTGLDGKQKWLTLMTEIGTLFYHTWVSSGTPKHDILNKVCSQTLCFQQGNCILQKLTEMLSFIYKLCLPLKSFSWYMSLREWLLPVLSHPSPCWLAIHQNWTSGLPEVPVPPVLSGRGHCQTWKDQSAKCWSIAPKGDSHHMLLI